VTTGDYPDNADGDALRRLLADGSDMSKPMEIEFAMAVPDESAGDAVAERARDLGYEVKVVFDLGEEKVADDPPSWTCYCRRDMIATYNAVIAAQAELDELSRPIGGYADGWGSFGNAEQA